MGPRHERIGPLDGSVDRPATATYPAGAVLGERVLDVHELVWVVRGSATVLAGGQEDVLRPGNVLLVPPGVVHAFRWGGRDEGAGGCVHGYVHGGLGQVAAAPRLVVAAGSASDPLGGLCAYLLWLGVREPPGWRDQATRTAALVADLVLRGPLPAAAAVPARPPVVEALLAELHRRWGPGPPLPAVGVAELAAAVHVSPAHLTRTVRRLWGRPLSTLLDQLRLTRVELLLTGTDGTVASIARTCGYADAFHCSRRFSAAHGLPPARYRAGAGRPSLLDDHVVRELADAVWGGPPLFDNLG
jgi:AraC family transcriptional regulator